MSFARPGDLYPKEGKDPPLSLQSVPEPGTGVLAIGPLSRAEVPALCERLGEIVKGGRVDVVVCDAGALVADLAAVEAVARLQLTARRLGCRVRFSRVSGELEALISFCGLAGALPLDGRRKAEQREQPRRVEERVEPDDPVP